MDEAKTQTVEIDRIRVEDGFNPRTDFDEGSLSELEASIRQTGLVTALTVRPNGEGYILIAGQRRLIAAKRAGLKAVPILVREGSDALAAAVAENLIRADLDPIEEANALARLAEAEKLATNKQLAERVGKSSAYVSERLRLLALPEAVQVQVAAGKVPVAAERELRKAAKVSSAIAECACKLVARGEIEGRDLLERFDEVLHAVAESNLRQRPPMVEVGRGAMLSQLVSDPEQHKALAERIAATSPYRAEDDPYLQLAEAEVDAARAAGRLLEYEVDHGGWTSSVAYLCDTELAADLALRTVERLEKEAAEQAKEITGEARSNGAVESSEQVQERVSTERREGREKARKDATKARSFNLDLGRKLLARRGAASRKEHSLARARALAEIVLADNPNLAARGLRLVLPQLQEVETKTLKSGESRETVSYRDAGECEDYLRKRISEAKTANEVLELLADALIAAQTADERELAQSRRIHWWSSAESRIAKLLAPDVKSVRPGRRRK
jgi:ParB/RepB/Spo0J family partition protein